MANLPSTTRKRWNESRGFSLVELLLSSVLGAIIVGVLGGVLLVTEIRTARQAIESQNLTDNSNQAANLILREIIEASQVSDTGTDSCGASIDVKLTLIGKGGAWKSVYGTRSAAGDSSDWFGPFVLVRCGPPYSVDNGGTLEANQSNVASVILDNLTDSDAFLIAIQTPTSSTLSRAVQFTIMTRIGAGNTIANTYQGRSASNPVYGLYDLIVQNPTYCSGQTSEIPCVKTGNTDHYLAPSGASQTITGDFNREEIIYFPGNIDDYSQPIRSPGSTEPCSRISCYIAGTVKGKEYDLQLEYFNVLVFNDTERRL